MTIDQQLRDALSQEAEMQNAPAPDVDRLIIGGKLRHRRRTLARAVVAAAAAALLAVGVYGATRVSSGSPVEPAGSPSPSTPQSDHVGSAIKSHPYRMLVYAKPSGAETDAVIIFHGAWGGDNFPVVRDGAGRYGGLAVYAPSALAAGSGCLSDPPNTDVGGTTQSLAQQLAHLPRSTILEPPTPVQAFGRTGLHLQLRIAQHCGTDVYRVAETAHGGHGISYGDPTATVVIDFWVVDVGGVPVVVETWHQDGASSRMVNKIADTGDSITFETRG